MRALLNRRRVLGCAVAALLGAYIVGLWGPLVSGSSSLTAINHRGWLDYLELKWESYQFEARQRAKQREVDAVTKFLPAVDEVIVYTLGDADPTLTTGFPIPGSSTLAPITSQKRLQGDDAQALASLWRSREFVPSFGYCYPAVQGKVTHGLRFTSRGRVKLDAAICWTQDIVGLSTFSDHLVDIAFDDCMLMEKTFRIAPPEPIEHLRILLDISGGLDLDTTRTLSSFLDTLRTLDPLDSEPEVIDGDRALCHGDWDTALYYYDLAIQKDPLHADAHFARGQWHAWQANYVRAIEDFDAALKVCPGPDFPRRLGHFSLPELRGYCRLAVDDLSGGSEDLYQSAGFMSQEALLAHVESRCQQFADGLQKTPRCFELQQSLALVTLAADRLRQAVRARPSAEHVSPDGALRMSFKVINGTGVACVDIVIHDHSDEELFRITNAVAKQERWLVAWGKKNTICIARGNSFHGSWDRTNRTTWSPRETPQAKNAYPAEIDRFLTQAGNWNWLENIRPSPIVVYNPKATADE